jgi:hypothetical protein
MYKVTLSLFVTGLFAVCSGGTVVYETASTVFGVSSHVGALALLDETVANSEHESEGASAFDDARSISPGGITLSNTESMEVLAVFLLGNSTDIADAPADADVDVARGDIFVYMPSIPLTIAIFMAGGTLILVGRLKRRRGSRRKLLTAGVR